jgi:uncharacterized membrane protein YqgA involved in biofilm formation
MLRTLPGRGTLLNTVAVIVGATLGLALQGALDERLKSVVLGGMGLVTIGIGVKMFLESRNVPLVALAVAVGGAVGALLGIDHGLQGVAEFLRQRLGGEGQFNEGLVTAAILFCVGPVSILGCIQDAIERKIDLLALKSVLDGVAGMFLAAAFGVGVLASAIIVLVYQGLLTLLARPLRPVAERPELLAEFTAAGGVSMIAIGLGLAGIHRFQAELFLPALAIAPLLAWLFGKQRRHDVQPREDASAS